MLDAIYNKVGSKMISIIAIVLAVVAIINFSLYFALFLPTTGGTAYLELNFGYSPADLYQYAELYGEDGRIMYVAMSATLDMLIPLCAGALIVTIAFYIEKKANQRRYLELAFTAGCGACISDWLENVSMISLLTLYPTENMAIAVAARAMTTAKYLFLILGVIVIAVDAYDLYRFRHPTQEDVDLY